MSHLSWESRWSPAFLSKESHYLRVLLSGVISRVIFNLFVLCTVLKKTILLVNSHAAILTY